MMLCRRPRSRCGFIVDRARLGLLREVAHQIALLASSLVPPAINRQHPDRRGIHKLASRASTIDQRPEYRGPPPGVRALAVAAGRGVATTSPANSILLRFTHGTSDRVALRGSCQTGSTVRRCCVRIVIADVEMVVHAGRLGTRGLNEALKYLEQFVPLFRFGMKIRVHPGFMSCSQTNALQSDATRARLPLYGDGDDTRRGYFGNSARPASVADPPHRRRLASRPTRSRSVYPRCEEKSLIKNYPARKVNRSECMAGDGIDDHWSAR